MVVVSFMSKVMAGVSSFRPGVAPPPITIYPPGRVVAMIPPDRPSRSNPREPGRGTVGPRSFRGLCGGMGGGTFGSSRVRLLSMKIMGGCFAYGRATQLVSVFA